MLKSIKSNEWFIKLIYIIYVFNCVLSLTLKSNFATLSDFIKISKKISKITAHKTVVKGAHFYLPIPTATRGGKSDFDSADQRLKYLLLFDATKAHLNSYSERTSELTDHNR